MPIEMTAHESASLPIEMTVTPAYRGFDSNTSMKPALTGSPVVHTQPSSPLTQPTTHATR